MTLTVKRVYDEPDPKDGMRILVDRLWPRGLSKENAALDVWLKSVAPSTGLRRWFQHDARKWKVFKDKYFAELDAGTEAVGELLGYINQSDVVLLYAAKDPEHNHAVALKEYIELVISQ
ncbi:Uncharacterized conserved protein YeaO, DUF488 family [Nitrosomonas marina]|uniref:Uncharacterized conserved protein YeaO, DUF488 family n=1 Tax=Nitrosomonas marina TaxID=917 RepID=A0A1I0A7Y3_9PROT|nr:DUF488 domain-containing protein [Nitrosomonas marina]SES90254.1 Uncharacterized conserved protein YeaO, DUF488 family [Nitrosomonas marina]